MAGKIILVTGGVRSGKSSFAERYATNAGSKVAYIATAQIYDTEMQSRVDLHRQRRPENWRTIEAPYANGQTMAQATVNSDAILFDCLTLYTSNLLLAPDIPKERKNRVSHILTRIDDIFTHARAANIPVIFVTNEVGLGIVPENALAREYRDIAGLVNQKAAVYADEVYLVVSGLAIELKHVAVHIPKEDQNG